MLYLITGVPGSGKTLYAVSTLIQKLLAEQVVQPDGSMLSRRLVVDGIPDLLLPHEVMPPLVEDLDKKDVFTCDGDGLLTWPKWCKPGDVIVVDEVQRYWRPRGMGTKPPDMIKALETHRHLGIDFVIITQNPMLIDQNVRRLIGRHQHVRRLFGMARAVIYDWDTCSMDVTRTKTATTTMWSYPKSAYKLYKSSVLHLKQRQKIPLWLAVPVLALVGGMVLAPKAFSTMSGAMTGKGVNTTASAPAVASSAPSFIPVLPVASKPAAAASGVAVASAAGVGAASGLPATSSFAGCISKAGRCKCFDGRGVSVDQDDDICESMSLVLKPVLSHSQLPDGKLFAPRSTVEDLDMVEFSRKHRTDDQAKFHVPKADAESSI